MKIKLQMESCDEHKNHKLIDTIDSFGEFEVNIQTQFVDVFFMLEILRERKLL